MQKRARLIAFYLPQYHPIPENDEWWGRGFTEWTNVAKAKPLFKGHYQPRIPADLGFYDLRVPEARAAQAELAAKYGVTGFCYYHYWFAGKRLLERPFDEVLSSGEPDFPFCLCWANDTWTGIWHGCPDRILIEQTYNGRQEDEAHFHELINAFTDKRYMTIDNKPAFAVYRPGKLPNPKAFTDHWRHLATKAGLKGLYFVGVADHTSWNPNKHGFDASVLHNPGITFRQLCKCSLRYADRICDKLTQRNVKELYSDIFSKPAVYSYEDFTKTALPELSPSFDQYPCVVPNWDNTPRSNTNGVVLHNSTPELFRIHLEQAIQQVALREPDKRVVFIKSWNEWAEGNYLEPDLRFGRRYLEVIADNVL